MSSNIEQMFKWCHINKLTMPYIMMNENGTNQFKLKDWKKTLSQTMKQPHKYTTDILL